MDPEQDQRPYIGVAVLIWKDEQLLLGRRIVDEGQNVWQFPGGRLESGETVLQCARREVLEETSLEISHLRGIGFTDETSQIDGQDYVTLYVNSSYAGGVVRVMEPERCECWRWFDYRDLPEPLFAPIIEYLKQIPDLGVYRYAEGTQEVVRR